MGNNAGRQIDGEEAGIILARSGRDWYVGESMRHFALHCVGIGRGELMSGVNPLC